MLRNVTTYTVAVVVSFAFLGMLALSMAKNTIKDSNVRPPNK
jgi:hypothetical protein